MAIDPPLTYCDAMRLPDLPEVHRHYHDEVYGFPVSDDDELFGRLVLELNQAGLSWTTILNKEAGFRLAYAQFDVVKVAAFGEADRSRLLADRGIIRNRLKVDAAIHNARRILEITSEHGSFRKWLDSHIGKSLEEWVKLFRKEFRFTGGEITKEFLLSTGYIPGAHVEGCPIYTRVVAARPPWLRS